MAPTFLRLAVRPLILLLILPAAALADPASVTIAGSLQSELGCPGDWQPECEISRLTLDSEDDVWQGTFDIPAGSWEYKAALNGSWDENYGANALRNGPNIPLNLSQPGSVKFYYDHKSHWITSNRNTTIVTGPGSYQSEIGCGGDWDPSCLRSWLQDPDGDGIYTMELFVPPGDYEVKAAINESWDENYGAGGAPNGPNIPFSVGAEGLTLFSYDANTHVLTVASSGPPAQPASVTIPGSFQSEIGCPGDWQPDCAATHLAFDADDGVWQETFTIPAGNWEYKAALNDSWDENYGANAQRDGPNIALSLGAPAAVKFYYDHGTHWVADNKTKTIATAPGSYQSEIGCSGDWDPSCLRSWLQDPEGDGSYAFSTRRLPAGTYEVKVTIDESWSENYGAGGVRDGANIPFTVPVDFTEIFFVYNATTHVLTVSAEGAPPGNIRRAQAHWVTADTIAWNAPAGTSVMLHYSASAGLALEPEGVTGGVDISLTADPAGLNSATRERFPHLATLSAFRIPTARLSEVPAALKSQLAVSAKTMDGTLVDATSLQIPGVLDDLYTYTGSLGGTFMGESPTLRLWAPTATSVDVVLFADSDPRSPGIAHTMALDAATGVWSVTGDPEWKGKYYLYDVRVYTPTTGQIERNLVTDPYSISLSRNSARSQIVNLSDGALKPAGWDSTQKPRLDAPEDVVLYELHVRDFSANDMTVPAPLRGTFKAFTQTGSNGMRHLAANAAAGLTHVHLLPSFDLATIDEDRSLWQDPGDLSGYAPDSDQQQAAVNAVADRDGFNWGYDPWHYTVPEGSYSTNPDGPTRILEFREMVQALSSIGLRTVMDVVYNHTNSSGQNDKSVLDKIVPGYYHRLNGDGQVERSSCCENTASEHNMMEKLLVDSALTWARHYKVDGFRFDLMGHHLKRNLLRLRQALDALTLEGDGVDGRKIYVYGEGWNFGEVANNARGVNATQLNMAGTGIGSFNDRIRDGARGGGPFSGLQEQGFLTGLWSDPNGTDQGREEQQRDRLLQLTDWIRVGLAGSLAGYTFVDRFGNSVPGRDIDYNGQPAGYTSDPQEIINYIDAHDNETLFDALQLKLPVWSPMAERVRAQNLGISLLALGQGVPFFHAGMDMLRSKSLDRNSYNSGDWFNRLDFSYASNNWGVGLPPERDNGENWTLFRPLLANPALRPAPADIADSVAHFREALAIRKSSPLFRLRTAADVQQHLTMLNVGPSQMAGLLVMAFTDEAGSIDRRHDLVAALLNGNDTAVSFAAPVWAGRQLALHPLQASSHDPLVRISSFDVPTGTFVVPRRTAAVFWSIRPLDAQIGLLAGDVDRLVSGNTTSLRAKLDAARDALQRGNRNAAANQLRAFINEVEALVNSRRLSSAAGATLIAAAQDILAQM